MRVRSTYTKYQMLRQTVITVHNFNYHNIIIFSGNAYLKSYTFCMTMALLIPHTLEHVIYMTTPCCFASKNYKCKSKL